MAQEQIYSIERKGNIFIFHSPEFLSKEMVDKFLQEISEFIEKMPRQCDDTGKTSDDAPRRCAIVLDFSKLSVSTMETKQIEEFVGLMAHYRFNSLVSVRPADTVFGESQVVQLLNKSLPMFKKRGIHVFIEKSMEDAMEKIKYFPCYAE
jgi:hypothetical protein